MFGAVLLLTVLSTITNSDLVYLCFSAKPLICVRCATAVNHGKGHFDLIDPRKHPSNLLVKLEKLRH